jgi:hypothetical protein
MSAKVIKQDREIKKLFYEKIKEKVEREKQNLKDKIDEEYPKILLWLSAIITLSIVVILLSSKRLFY